MLSGVEKVNLNHNAAGVINRKRLLQPSHLRLLITILNHMIHKNHIRPDRRHHILLQIRRYDIVNLLHSIGALALAHRLRKHRLRRSRKVLCL